MSRYDRQEKFHAFGSASQRRLARLHVLIVGVGALGSGIAEQLTRSGIGKLTILDKDIVSLSIYIVKAATLKQMRWTFVLKSMH